jgi:carbon storage regulator
MLVLSRYRDESIYIGDNVVVTIVDIRGDRVRLGIQAPPDISVYRQEIYDAIMQGKNELTDSATNEQSEFSKIPKKYVAPLAKKMESLKSKALPVEIDSPPINFGNGITDIISQ